VVSYGVCAFISQHVGLAIKKLWVVLLSIPLSSNDCASWFSHMCLSHKTIEFGIGQRLVMLWGWEGNRGLGRK